MYLYTCLFYYLLLFEKSFHNAIIHIIYNKLLPQTIETTNTTRITEQHFSIWLKPIAKRYFNNQFSFSIISAYFNGFSLLFDVYLRRCLCLFESDNYDNHCPPIIVLAIAVFSIKTIYIYILHIYIYQRQEIL